MDIQDLRTHIFVGNDLNVRLEFTGAELETLFERLLSLREAHGCLRAGDAARLPFFVRLAAQKPDEDPHTFLARLWQIGKQKLRIWPFPY